MKYILLIHTDPAGDREDSPEDMYAQYTAFVAEVGAKGKLLDGHELTDPETATLVRVRDGERLVTDGPYSATKEHLGGYFVVEADDLDEAIGYAAKIPGAKHGQVEVRALVVRS